MAAHMIVRRFEYECRRFQIDGEGRLRCGACLDETRGGIVRETVDLESVAVSEIDPVCDVCAGKIEDGPVFVNTASAIVEYVPCKIF